MTRFWVGFVGLTGLLLLSNPTAAADFSDQFSLVSQRSSALGKSLIEMRPDDLLLSIDRKLLGKPLLFLPTIVADSSPRSTTDSLGAKRVIFQLIGKSLYFVESVQGKIVTTPYPHEKLVAEFPILEATDDRIVFDFKKGFDRLIVGTPPGAGVDEDMLLPVAASYLRDPISHQGLFGFHHVVQMATDVPATVTFSYAFLPDRRPSFRPIPAEEMKTKVGLFLSHPLYDAGSDEEHRFISRWDIKRPIVFWISSNTPSPFRDAVRDAVESWNVVFGRRVIIAKMAPGGVTAGDPRYNMIQWVNWKEMGLGYADWHTHPLTGETLHANVIFIDGWVALSKEDAIRLLKRLDEMPSTTTAKKQRSRFGLQGFAQTRLCEGFTPDASYRALLEKIANGEIDEKAILPLMQRIVKAVIMHEVGHDLGLRHNFAGNLGSEISPSDDDADLAARVRTYPPQEGEWLPSSSIMDYLIFADALRMDRPGAYDAAAIRWAYMSTQEERERMQFPPFCTDGDIRGDADCKQGDAWADPLDWRIRRAANEVDWFNKALIRSLTKGEAAKEDEPTFVDEFLWRLIDLFDGMGSYLYKDIAVRALEGKSADARRRGAGESLARYLWSDEHGVGPVGALVTPESLAARDSFNKEQRQRFIEMMRGIRNGTVEFLLSLLHPRFLSPDFPVEETRAAKRAPISVPFPPPPAGLAIVDIAKPAILASLVELAANAGLPLFPPCKKGQICVAGGKVPLFADLNDHRREATVLVAQEKNAVGRESQEKLRKKLLANIAYLERILAPESFSPERRQETLAALAFEKELLAILDQNGEIPKSPFLPL